MERLPVAVSHYIWLSCLEDWIVHRACKAKGTLYPSTTVALMEDLIVSVIDLSSDHSAERWKIIALSRRSFSFWEGLLSLELFSWIVRVNLMSFAERLAFIKRTLIKIRGLPRESVKSLIAMISLANNHPLKSTAHARGWSPLLILRGDQRLLKSISSEDAIIVVLCWYLRFLIALNQVHKDPREPLRLLNRILKLSSIWKRRSLSLCYKNVDWWWRLVLALLLWDVGEDLFSLLAIRLADWDTVCGKHCHNLEEVLEHLSRKLCLTHVWKLTWVEPLVHVI